MFIIYSCISSVPVEDSRWMNRNIIALRTSNFHTCCLEVVSPTSSQVGVGVSFTNGRNVENHIVIHINIDNLEHICDNILEPLKVRMRRRWCFYFFGYITNPYFSELAFKFNMSFFLNVAITLPIKSSFKSFVTLFGKGLFSYLHL